MTGTGAACTIDAVPRSIAHRASDVVLRGTTYNLFVKELSTAAAKAGART
jgi:hypothetical protein